MYTTTDFEAIKAQIRRRSLLLLGAAVLLLVPAVMGVVAHLNRDTSLHWLTYTSLVILSALLLFVDGLFIMPLRGYKRHINTVLFGRKATLHGQFKSLDETVCMRDHVAFYPLIANVGDLRNEEDDRLFYYDVLKPRPPFAEGDAVTIISHDKNIADIVHRAK